MAKSTDQNVTHGSCDADLSSEHAFPPDADRKTVSDWPTGDPRTSTWTLPQSYPAEMEMIVNLIDEDHANYDTDTAQKNVFGEPGETTHLVFTRERWSTAPSRRPLRHDSNQTVSLLHEHAQVRIYVDIDHVAVTKLTMPAGVCVMTGRRFMRSPTAIPLGPIQ